jgi:proteic killer suppression protein
MAIQSFRSDDAEQIFHQRPPGKGFPADLIRVTRRKLIMLHHARTLNDLKVPPNNRLHALTGDRQGQHAIRINDQFRICFVWSEAGPAQVEFTDYH